MKKLITLAIVLMLSITANAQREYRGCYDDVYSTYDNRCSRQYDEVEEVCDEVTNKLVIHKTKKNVYHVNEGVEERHYNINGRFVGYVSRGNNISSRRVVTVPSRTVVPRVSYYEPVEQCRNTQYSCLGDNNDMWYFVFQLNSDYLTNKEELLHLINYAVSNPYANFYIDAYADADTGSYNTNMNISRARANRVIEVLIREGINRNRLYVSYHGSVVQPYNTNNLNRCVTVSTVAR